MVFPAADHVEILNLLATYNHAIDYNDPEAWADCFTEDGVFDARPVTHSKGREELMAFVTASSGGTRHWTTNPLIHVDGDTATLDLYLMTVTPGQAVGDAPQPGVTGRYHDELVRVNGAWKIKHRKLDFDVAPKGFE